MGMDGLTEVSQIGHLDSSCTSFDEGFDTLSHCVDVECEVKRNESNE